MKFSNAILKSVKADIGAGEITITFRISLNDLPVAEKLVPYLPEESGGIDVEINPHQLPLFREGTKVEIKALK